MTSGHSGDQPSRRQFNRVAAISAAGITLGHVAENHEETPPLVPNYLLASCMYGYLDLAEILPEVHQAGAAAIDIWPKVHGNQREQMDDLGEEKFAEMLESHNVALGCITQFQRGPFGLQEEMRLAQRFGCQTIVTGSVGPASRKGAELKSAVRDFVEKLKPHLAVAGETGVTIAIENHSNSLIESPDSMKWFAELATGVPLGIAFAPYHLPQDPAVLATLAGAVGNVIRVFYAWQFGKGCIQKLPKEQEMLQLPGRGELDFTPLMSALAAVGYDGWTEIFMHPVPRGVPILETAREVTDEINRSRQYLAGLLQ
jgi:sugar phosphate isomerase/epimerase